MKRFLALSLLSALVIAGLCAFQNPLERTLFDESLVLFWWSPETGAKTYGGGQTFTRASAATYIDSTGIQRQALTTAQRGELLTNGTLDTPGGGGDDAFGTWAETKGAGGTISGTTTAGEFHTGTAAKLLRGTADGYITQSITTVAATSYVVSFWTRGDGTNAGRYYLYDNTNSAVVKAITTTAITGMAYTRFSYTFTTPAGCISLLVGLYNTAADGGTAYFDDVSLAASPTNFFERTSHYIANPVSGINERSLLLEGQRSNGWTYSRDLSQGVYTPTRASVATDTTKGPDNSTLAYKLIEDGTAGNTHFIIRNAGTITDTTNQTFSFAAQAAGRNWVAVETTNKANQIDTSYVNVATGAAGTIDAQHTIRITGPFNGYYRVACTWASGSGATTPTIAVYLAEADTDYTFDGNSTSGVYLTDMQMEVDQSFASSVIPTVAAPVTRSADALSFPFPFPPQSMTVYARCIDRGIGNGDTIVNIGSGTSYLRLYGDVPNYRLAYKGTGAGQVSTTVAQVQTVGNQVELHGILYSDGTVKIGRSNNGAAETLSALSPADTMAAAFGSLTLTTGGTGLIAFQRVVIARGVRSMQEMRRLGGYKTAQLYYSPGLDNLFQFPFWKMRRMPVEQAATKPRKLRKAA